MNRDFEKAVLVLRSTNQNFSATRDALKKLLQLDNQGYDILTSIKDVVKVLPLPDHVIKKLSCHLISRLADKVPGTGLLAHNTLSNDLRDPNPQVRGLALRTLCQCAHDTEEATEAVSVALDDDSPYVRRTAALGVLHIARRSVSECSDTLINRLYAALRDPDPLVVGHALAALDEVLSSEGGAVINRNIAHHLAARVATLDEWSSAFVLRALERYLPGSEEELFQLLDTLDPGLRHANCAVAVSTTSLFLRLLSTPVAALLPRDLRPDVYHGVCRRLSFVLGDAANAELVQLVINFVEEQLSSDPSLSAAIFAPLAASLPCKYGEADSIKVGKIRLISRVAIATSESAGRVLDEVAMYCTSASLPVSQAAVEAVAQVARNSDSVVFQRCLERLLRLLTVGRGAMTARVLTALQSLELGGTNDMPALASALGDCGRLVGASDEAAIPLTRLLGEHGSSVPDAPYILERLTEEEPESADTRLALLLATLKLFFVRPAECQPILARVMDRCRSDVDVEVRKRVGYYHWLLRHDVHLARRIVQSETYEHPSQSSVNVII